MRRQLQCLHLWIRLPASQAAISAQGMLNVRSKVKTALEASRLSEMHALSSFVKTFG